jgi:hypothetical protein
LFRQKQAKKLKKQDDTSSNTTLIKLIEQYGTPMHVIVRQSINDDKNNVDSDDTDDDDDQDFDNVNDNDNDRKNWIEIIDNDFDDNNKEDLSPQQKQEEKKGAAAASSSSLSNLQPQRQRHPLVLIDKKKYIRRIQRQLEDTNYVLLKVYKGHTYYLCQTTEMQQKISEHMVRTNAYILLHHSKHQEKYKTFSMYP